MVFNVHYISDPKSPKAGEVMSYQEGPEETPEDEVPPGCKCLSFPGYIEGFVNVSGGQITMKVDLSKSKLVAK